MQTLYNKYKIEKTSGEPVDPEAVYFVLRIDTDKAARLALMFYADVMHYENGEELFAEQLRDLAARYNGGSNA